MNTKHPYLAEELEYIAALDLPYERFDGASVAISGAGGLVGNYLTRALCTVRDRRGLDIRLISLCRDEARSRSQLEGTQGIEYVRFDAEELAPIELRADFVIHAASNAHPRAFASDPVGTMRANFLGTMRLLETLKTGARFLMISTGEIYGENPEVEDGFTEGDFGRIDPMDPRACYPESKRAAETLCAAYMKQHEADALSARLCYVFGGSANERSSRADAQFLFNALRGEDIVLKSEAKQLRSYCYIADAAAAIMTILLKGESGKAYNVASPACTSSIRDYAQTLADAANVRLTYDLPPESERQGYSKVTKAVLNPDRLLKLGWTPKYDLKEALERTLAIAGK